MVFPRLLLLVVPVSTSSRNSQRNFLVASGGSPLMTRAATASSHSADIVRSNPILLSRQAFSFCPCDRHERNDDFFDANPAMRHRSLSFSDEGAKRWRYQGKVVIGQPDTWPFQ